MTNDALSDQALSGQALSGAHVRLTDTSLRDGSHAKRHQFTKEHVSAVVSALDAVGMPVIEVAHGDGLGGSSFNYGKSKTPELELIATAVDNATNARIACLLLPGLGTKDDIHAVQSIGAHIVRVATHCTEADISIQHFGLAREVGLETVGFLMMAHTASPAVLAEQAVIMADAGCQCVYVVDSAGAMLPNDAAQRVEAVYAALDGQSQVGFHGHENLSLSLANSLVAIAAGAAQIDGSTRRFGAGAGNTSCEAFVAVADKAGITTGIDVLGLIDVAEDVVRPIMDNECVMDRLALIMGYAGVYSSFLKHAYRAAERYDVSGAQMLLACGEAQLVGGQEDQIIQIAAQLAAQKEANHELV